MSRATYPDNERTSALARASSFARRLEQEDERKTEYVSLRGDQEVFTLRDG